MQSFKEIQFGYASAETESSETPMLLNQGFLDKFIAVPQILDSKGALILGSKGTGKSAVGEKLRLLAKDKFDLFVHVRNLSTFPYKRFGSIIPGRDEPESNFPLAWDFLLLISLYSSIAEDRGITDSANLEKILAILRDHKLIVEDDLNKLASVCMKKSFQLKIPVPLIGGEFNLSANDNDNRNEIIDVASFTKIMECFLTKIHTNSRHILIIDGLDDVMIYNSNQNRVLSALIQSATRLNRLFSHEGPPISIVILCRTDIFQVISNPNKNKIKQDYGIVLDWYHDPQKPEKSGLMDLVNLRAKNSLGEINDVFYDFFPDILDGQPIRKWLLEHTRHTPRDFIQLLKYIQKNFDKGEDSKALQRSSITAGARQYSIDYFFPEIRDSLVGIIPEEQIEFGIDTLSSLRKRDFSYSDFEFHARDVLGESRFENLNVRQVLSNFFNVGAIGNKTTTRSHVMYTFKYRNPISRVNFQEQFTIHKGLWKAFNLI